MRFVCESCRAQYMINDEKVGPKGVKVRCRKCGYVIHVKRTDGAGAAARSGPVLSSADPDDATATQVMNSPLATPGADATLDLTNPLAPTVEASTTRVNMNDPEVKAAMDAKAEKTAARSGAQEQVLELKGDKPGESFLGADEDEIGAVFDSVLAGGSTGPTAAPKEGVEGDRESTRVLDADMVKKLAQESNTVSKPDLAKIEEVPQQDWYVAINDKQTGPLPLEQIKQHWDRGEIGPDSLCWRAGYGDWLPVSEVKILASVLAPKPAKPIVVAAAATVSSSLPPPASIISVPVQSAFSSGGVVQTVQSELQLPIAAAALPSIAGAGEDTGTWKPSAASALASLVKDEMEAMARPAPKKPEPAPEAGLPGLLDVPAAEQSISAPRVERAAEAAPARPAPAPLNPYLSNQGATFSAPAVTQYRPPSNRGLIIGLGVGGGVVLISLVVLVVFLAMREPKVVVAAPPVVAQPVQPPVAAQPPVAVAAVPPPTVPEPAVPPTAVPAQPVAAVTPLPAEPTPAPPTSSQQAPGQPTPAAAAKTTGGTTRPTGTRVAAAGQRDKEPVAEKPEKPERQEPARESKGGGDDDFAEAFGDDKKAPARAEEPAEKPKRGGYIPPPPGGAGGDLKDELGSSDILETVLANKAGLGKCAEEQRNREPGSSGKLVMKWTIQTSGKPTNVSVVTEELKGTYMAGCVGNLIKSMSFPRHKKQGEPVQFPFKF